MQTIKKIKVTPIKKPVHSEAKKQMKIKTVSDLPEIINVYDMSVRRKKISLFRPVKLNNETKNRNIKSGAVIEVSGGVPNTLQSLQHEGSGEGLPAVGQAGRAGCEDIRVHPCPASQSRPHSAGASVSRGGQPHSTETERVAGGEVRDGAAGPGGVHSNCEPSPGRNIVTDLPAAVERQISGTVRGSEGRSGGVSFVPPFKTKDKGRLSRYDTHLNNARSSDVYNSMSELGQYWIELVVDPMGQVLGHH